MPFRKTYQINNREEGKAAQRDQSYRSCIITLLIVFFLCLILILACIPWKIRNEIERNHYTEHELQHHYQERTNETTVTVSSTTRKIPIITILSRTLEPSKAIITSTDSRPTEDTYVITKDYSKKNVKGSHHFERYLKTTSGNKITSSITSISQEDIKDYNIEKVFKNIKTIKKNSDFSTSSLDSVTNNDTPTSQNEMISTTLKYVTTIDNYITLLTTLSLPNRKNNTTNSDYSAKNNSENSV